MTFILSLLAGIVALCVAVFVHELGHFLAARLRGIKIDTFSVGMGPVAYSWLDGSGTTWQVSVLPLGGYVAPDSDSYRQSTIVDRLAMVAAGPVFSIAFAVPMFLLVTMFITMDVSAIQYAVGKTVEITGLIAEGTYMLVTGQVDLKEAAGPIGIVDNLRQSAAEGMGHLAFRMGVISIALGITNMLPIVPLDGGKIMCLVFEAILGLSLIHI